MLSSLTKKKAYRKVLILTPILDLGAKVDWDFRIYHLVKIPDGTDV